MTEQELLKARIQQEIANKISTKILEELKVKDYQLRVIKCKLIMDRLEKKMQENNMYMANRKYDSLAVSNAMYANKQLNEIYNMISTIMLE